MRKLLLSAFFFLLLCSCMEDENPRSSFTDFDPMELEDGWEISSPEAKGFDTELLEDLYADVHNREDLWMLRSFLIFKDGHLVTESYTKDEMDWREKRPFWSCTKQVLAMLVGIAWDRGMIESLEDPIGKYIEGMNKEYPDKAKISIAHYLNMNSGIDFENLGIDGDNFYLLQNQGVDFATYALERPIAKEAGSEFRYKESDPILLMHLIDELSGGKAEEWAREVLVDPLGVELEWLKDGAGLPIGGYGILSTPREMAKFAQLALNGGTWNGKQIISKEYLDMMVSPISLDTENYFGYMWWSYPEENLYFMNGNGRQLFFVMPEDSLLVAMTSDDRLLGDMQLSTRKGRELCRRVREAMN